MTELGHSWRFPAQDYEWAIGEALIQRVRLQAEGHASVISQARGDAGEAVLVITVRPGRPKGGSDVYGDDDLELDKGERAHFGLDLRGP